MNQQVTSTITQDSVFAFEAMDSILQSQKEIWTLQKFADVLGYQTRGAVSLVLSGKRKLSAEAATRFAAHLGLRGLSRRYFEALFLMYSAEPQSSRWLQGKEELKKIRSQKAVRVTHQAFRPQAKKWLSNFIREMHFLKHREITPSWIANHSIYSASIREISETLKTFLDVEKMRSTPMGDQPITQHLVIGQPNQENSERREVHQQMLNLAKQALQKCPIEERSFDGLMICLDSKRVPELKRRIDRFLDEINHDFSTRKGDQVYYLNSSLFPMSKKTKTSKEQNHE